MATEIKPSQEIRKTPPVHALTSFEEMDRLFDSFVRRSWPRAFQFEWPSLPEITLPFSRAPNIDVIDREADVTVRAEIPGVDKKDIDITVGEDSVILKGSTRHEEKEEKGDYYRRELTSGSFSRTVGLPAQVDGTRAKASFKDGVLELILPKIEKAKRHSVKVE
jgi:HSP20 family protein